MKKFKYLFYNKIIESKERERFNQLDNISKRNLRINKLVGKTLFISYFFIVAALIVLTIMATKSLDGVWKGLFPAFMLIIILIFPIVPVIIFFAKISEKFPVAYKELTQQSIRNITKPLVEYYKIPSAYIVTKCYSCTNEDVKNKDVIIFVHDGKLRIVNDLFHSLYDFGCYEFDYKDLTYFNIVDNGIVKTTIRTNDCEFILGYRAKTFIKKNFENQITT